MADLEELDFSSYLVDIDDGAAEDAPALHNAFAPVHIQQQPKAWSGALTASATLSSVSPSPPETSNSEASFKAISAPSTAPSSVFSTSFPNPSTSWGTIVSPVASAAGLAKTKPASNHPAHRQQVEGSSTSFPASVGAVAAPPVTGFNYDFAHNPSADFETGGRLSAGPSSASLSSLKRASRNNSVDKSQDLSSSFLSGQGVSPSSGPSNGRGHRTKSSVSFSTLVSTASGQSSWPLPAPSTSQTASTSHQMKPYARPSDVSLIGTTGIAASGTSLGPKRSVKRKTMSNASASTALPPVRKEAQFSLRTMDRNNVALDMSAATGYREPFEPLAALFSPTSPSQDSIAAFSAQYLAGQPGGSAATSPGQQFSNPSSASTPSDNLLAANVGFSPKNFADLTVAADFGSVSRSNSSQSPAAQPYAAAIVPVASGSGTARSSQPVKKDKAVPRAAADAILGEPLIPPSVATAVRRGREASLAPEGLDELDGDTPEAMAARDPLATHLWRVYAKAKSGLPNGARMENLTWRMMSLKLNKQRAAEAQAAADAKAQAEAEASRKASEAAEEERGRRGRSIGNSASPQDDFGEMDWRQQSRSRSRAPMGGMDWRAASRSRSRAPNARISISRGGSGFQLPQYIESSESRASASRTDVYAYQPRSSTSSTFHAAPSGISAQVCDAATGESDGYGSIEATLKQLIASTESTAQRPKSKTPPSASGRTPPPAAVTQPPTPSSFTYVAPTPLPLPLAPTSWNSTAFDASVASSYVPSSLDHPLQPDVGSIQPITADTASSRSGDSISRSIEAYLASLNYPSSHIDMHTSRHVGSVPGLFDEQGLKHNQHAEYGFLPKLVRKTSFDASYPAQLAQLQQKQQKKPKASAGPLNDPAQRAVAASLIDYSHLPSYSTPGTPSIANANMPFNFDFPRIVPTLQQQQQLGGSAVDPQPLAHEQASAMEALRRLQAAQAMQAAQQHQAEFEEAQARQQQQQQQQFQVRLQQMQMELMKSIPYQSFVDPTLLAQSAPTPSAFPAVLSPMQMGQMQGNLPFNAFSLPASGEALTPWSALPAAPSPPTTQSTPDATTVQEGPASGQASLASSRSNSHANVAALATTALEVPVPKGPARTPGQPANADPSSPTTCINCKTTNTPLWRRDENGNPLCNACQLFRKLHGSDRPVSLHNSVVKKRNRARAKDVPKKTTARSMARRGSNAAAVPTPAPVN